MAVDMDVCKMTSLGCSSNIPRAVCWPNHTRSSVYRCLRNKQPPIHIRIYKRLPLHKRMVSSVSGMFGGICVSL